MGSLFFRMCRPTPAPTVLLDPVTPGWLHNDDLCALVAGRSVDIMDPVLRNVDRALAGVPANVRFAYVSSLQYPSPPANLYALEQSDLVGLHVRVLAALAADPRALVANV